MNERPVPSSPLGEIERLLDEFEIAIRKAPPWDEDTARDALLSAIRSYGETPK